MNLIGLTGGIGSGKSTVAEVFMTLGIPVYESDARAKLIMADNSGIRQQIIDLLGLEAYQHDELNRSWIASQVFSDRDKLEKLNAIVHPAVYEDLKVWASEESQSGAPYVIQESAILFEENLTSRLKAIILVVADVETRIDRVMDRDQITREKVEERMMHQWTDEIKIPLSDYIIFNDKDRSVINQAIDIDKMIRASLTND